MGSNEQNKLTYKIEMDAQLHGADRRKDSGDWMKEGEGISQRTCMSDQWIQATMRRLPERAEECLVEVGKERKSRATVIE